MRPIKKHFSALRPKKSNFLKEAARIDHGLSIADFQCYQTFCNWRKPILDAKNSGNRDRDPKNRDLTSNKKYLTIGKVDGDVSHTNLLKNLRFKGEDGSRKFIAAPTKTVTEEELVKKYIKQGKMRNFRFLQQTSQRCKLQDPIEIFAMFQSFTTDS